MGMRRLFQPSPTAGHCLVSIQAGDLYLTSESQFNIWAPRAIACSTIAMSPDKVDLDKNSWKDILSLANAKGGELKQQTTEDQKVKKGWLANPN